jgi:hypothetical protein
MEQENPGLKAEELHADDKACVSLTRMDVSCNLSNLSHFDIHNAGLGLLYGWRRFLAPQKIGTLFSQICMELTLAIAIAVISLQEWQLN